MPTQTSNIRMEATGTDKTAAMFESVRGQLQKTQKQLTQMQQPSLDARKAIGGVGGALQNILQMAGGGPLASAVGQVKGMSMAVAGLGVSVQTAMPIIGAAVAAWKLYEYAQKKVRQAQDEAKQSAEELARVQAQAAKSVASAYDKVIAKTKELRAARDALRTAERSVVTAGNATEQASLEAEGIRRMLDATSVGDRERIRKETAALMAEAAHNNDMREANWGVADAKTAISRNERDRAKLLQEIEALQRMGGQRERVQELEDAVAALEFRRKELQARLEEAQAKRHAVETTWQRDLLKRQLEAQEELEKAAEEAAKKREQIEKRLADLRKKREEEIGKAREQAAAAAQRFVDGYFAAGVADNMRGASVQSAADVARAIALTSGPNAQFRRDAGGLVMSGAAYSKEEMSRIKTEKYQQEVTRLLSDINRKYDEAEAAVAQEEF